MYFVLHFVYIILQPKNRYIASFLYFCIHLFIKKKELCLVLIMAFTSLFHIVVFTLDVPIINNSETKDVVYRYNDQFQTWTDTSDKKSLFIV